MSGNNSLVWLANIFNNYFSDSLQVSASLVAAIMLPTYVSPRPNSDGSPLGIVVVAVVKWLVSAAFHCSSLALLCSVHGTEQDC